MYRGSSCVPKLRVPGGSFLPPGTVEERSVGLRRRVVRRVGGIGSANADMSSDNAGEKPARRKPKVSCATLIGAG